MASGLLNKQCLILVLEAHSLSFHASSCYKIALTALLIYLVACCASVIVHCCLPVIPHFFPQVIFSYDFDSEWKGRSLGMKHQVISDFVGLWDAAFEGEVNSILIPFYKVSWQ